ncbi:MAG: 7-carboxy-7-deazaguanine synthase QueE [Planctomycetes bacterium]|nr:7-carboxy-7-deazaguanine synthase QueE [Planctomycetota bacterium]
MAARAPLIEIFDSVQGEGRFVGQPMVFVRTATCPIRCAYCDTPHSYEAPPAFEVRARGRVLAEPNPTSAERAVELVGQVVDRASWTASLTGGEPLVFPAFVAEFARAARRQGSRVHLETAALDPHAMREVVDVVDHVSADWKLPGTLADRGDWRAQHLGCVEVAALAGRSIDVKAVLTNDVTDAAFDDMLVRLGPFVRAIVLVLQPVTPFGAVQERCSSDQVLRRLDAAIAAGFDARVVPQTHRVLGVD